MPKPDAARPDGVTAAPYGTWSSPVTARLVAGSAVRLGSVTLDHDDIYWVEGRPDEGGRHVIVRRTPDGQIADATPTGTNVRTRVHEYGGAAYLVSRGVLYYSEFADQRLYKLVPGGTPEAMTPAGDWFYADASIDAARGRIVCVREDHTAAGEAVSTLVSLPLEGPQTAGQIIVSGNDFYAAPRVSPDGSQLAWLTWRHPQMPWDGTELWVADVAADGTLGRSVRIAGSDTESIFQPEWSPDGTLYFVSDRTGWWNLYRAIGGLVEAIHPMSADFGRPQWQIGARTWAFVGSSRLVVSYVLRGRWQLATIDLQTGILTPSLAEIEPADSLVSTPTHAVMVGGSATSPEAIVRVALATGAVEHLRAAATTGVPGGFISAPQPIEYPTGNGLTAHAFYYAPCNPQFTCLGEERPPLIVISHGGPTAATYGRLNLEVQYWTSRGFSVVDVNYGGSSGYGRAYRQRLNGQWGIVDVEDCVNAAKYLVARGDADTHRLIIRGRSAGGYTTLAALTFHPDVFHAGASYYGVADLEQLASDTHKFESRYLDTLLEPYASARDVYRQRSPIHFVDRLSCPVILFQGLEDRVVPPNQAQMMADAVRAKGLPAALVTFEGEQHGFRKADTIVRCLDTELFFYGAVFGFTPAGLPPVFDIDNLAGWRARRNGQE
jgi:dipeptidyl aminopeptidase/acylaminoacyl peptidase